MKDYNIKKLDFMYKKYILILEKLKYQRIRYKSLLTKHKNYFASKKRCVFFESAIELINVQLERIMREQHVMA